MDQKQKVLLVNDFESGGGAEGVFQMTVRLLDSHYEVYQYTAHKGFKDSGVNPLAYIYSRKHFNNIKSIILEKNIDIVHVHNFRWITPSVFHVHRWLIRNKKEKRVRFVLTAHDYFLACPNVAYGYYKRGIFQRYTIDKPPGSFLFKQMDQQGWKYSWLKKIQWYTAFRFLKLHKDIDQVISPSFFLKKIIQLNYPTLPVDVIHNPIGTAFQSLKSEIAHSSDNEVLRIVYFGRVASEKGTDILLKMLSSIRDKVVFRLDIFGTGPMSEEINSMIKRLGLEGVVFYHGFKPFAEVQAQLHNFDAFIMSSVWYENAPLSIVEAAMAGLKLIVPNMGGMKELAELCGNDYLYEVDNRNSFENVLYRVILSKQKKHLIDNADQIKTLFSEKLYLDKIKEVYENSTHG